MHLTDTGATALPPGLARQGTLVLPSLPEADGEGSDPLALARGIGLALVVSVVFWIVLGGTIFWLLPMEATT